MPWEISFDFLFYVSDSTLSEIVQNREQTRNPRTTANLIFSYCNSGAQRDQKESVGISGVNSLIFYVFNN